MDDPGVRGRPLMQLRQDKAAIQSHQDMVDSLDYEVELAVIIGADAKDVPPEKVKDYKEIGRFHTDGAVHSHC